ncbi:MAG: class B sortase [Ruminococcus sp.]|nr:class B sortase [Ruminococcus sp.]
MNKETEEKPKKKLKLKLRTKIIIGIIIVVLCSAGLALSTIEILKWNKDNKVIEDIMNDLDDVVKVDEVPSDHEDIQIVNPPETNPPVESDYYKYLKLPLINVDFSELSKINSDTVGYITVSGTTINYPIVQTSDNEYYLNHAFNKTINNGGWVFLDYRNDINNLQDNTIIYAHGRMNTTMFGSLKNILTSNWYRDTSNYVVNLSTPSYNTLWQVFSVYSIPTETYYITSSFATVESKQKFLDTIAGRSKFEFSTTVNTNDKILTLSTCLNDNEKVVLHAKLIKQQAR